MDVEGVIHKLNQELGSRENLLGRYVASVFWKGWNFNSSYAENAQERKTVGFYSAIYCFYLFRKVLVFFEALSLYPTSQLDTTN